MTERKRYTKQTYGTPYNHITPRQCKYDRVRTLTVHHTNTNKDTSKTTHKECGKHKWLLRNHAKALSMRVRPRAYTNGTNKRRTQCKYDVCVHNGTPYKQDDTE